MMLSIAESMKLARKQLRNETDNTNKLRLTSCSAPPIAGVKYVLEYTGPKEQADLFLDDATYTIDIGSDRYLGCQVKRRQELSADYWSVMFDYERKLVQGATNHAA